MAASGEHTYQFGAFLLNATERVLLREGKRVPLRPKAFETLLVLVENAGHIVQKETLIKRVWPDAFVQEDNLTFNISILRKALGDHPGGQQFIQTEHKVGYRFVAPVKILDSTMVDNGQLGRNPLTRPAPAEESAGCGPPSPPRGRGKALESGRGKALESGRGKDLESGRGKDLEMERGADFRVGSWQDIARGRGEDIKGGSSAGSAAALHL